MRGACQGRVTFDRATTGSSVGEFHERFEPVATPTATSRSHQANHPLGPRADPILGAYCSKKTFAVNSRRLLTPALTKTDFRWSWTVYDERCSRCEIPAVSTPWSTRAAKSSSRLVSPKDATINGTISGAPAFSNVMITSSACPLAVVSAAA